MSAKKQLQERFAKGLFYIQCPVCGMKKLIYLKEWQDKVWCELCGQGIYFDEIRGMKFHCDRCDRFIVCHTNIVAEYLEQPCPRCGKIIRMNYIPSENRYRR